MTRVNSIDDLPPRAREQARRQLAEQERTKVDEPAHHGDYSFTRSIHESSTPAINEPKPSKYHNVKITTEDGTFDSKREYARWLHLKGLQAIGTIAGLQRQVPFALCCNGTKVCDYIADFTYIYSGDSGRVTIEDLKGVATDIYRLKRTMMDAHGWHINEIKKPSSPAGYDERVQPKRGPK